MSAEECEAKAALCLVKSQTIVTQPKPERRYRASITTQLWLNRWGQLSQTNRPQFDRLMAAGEGDIMATENQAIVLESQKIMAGMG